MSGKDSMEIHTASAIGLPGNYALPAVETILSELARFPGAGSLALEIQQLHVPLQAMISVPVETRVIAQGRAQWQLRICAASKPKLYPTFAGVLSLAPATERSCELRLAGAYEVPLGLVGRAIDSTLLCGAAQTSLERFVREIANRVATLARWAKLA